VLDYNVPKPNNLHRWVAGEFKRLDIKADADASRALVEIVGDDSMALSNEILKLGSWAGGGDRPQTSSGSPRPRESPQRGL
jgi:DNA polymerase III delta subunit